MNTPGKKPSVFSTRTIAVAGIFLCALGLAVIAGWLGADMTLMKVFPSLASMRFNTASVFALFGSSVAAFAWIEGRDRKKGAPVWLPLSIGLVAVVITAILWQALIAHENAAMKRIVKLKAEAKKDEIKDHMKLRILALERMAARWEKSGRPPRALWEYDATLYVKHYAGYEAIEWVGPSLQERWVVTSDGKMRSDAGITRKIEGVLRDDKNRGEVGVSYSVELRPGVKGLIVSVPLYNGKVFDGFIVGVLGVRDTLGPLLRNVMEDGLSVVVSRGNEALFTEARNDAGADFSYESGFELYGALWTVRIWPNREHIDMARSALPEVVLVMGVMTSFLLAGAVYFYLTALRREVDLKAVNREMRHAEEELMRYSGRLEEMVEERTVELKESNEKLTNEVHVRKEAEDAVAKVNEALVKKNRELEGLNKEMEALTYSASHDLQEPLRIVAGYVQLLSRRYKGRLDSAADEFINYAVDATVRMQRLINDILSYSRVGARHLKFKPVDCERVLSLALADLRSTIQESGAVITHGPLPAVMADETQMERLFDNLLGNAVKYCGGKTPAIHVSAVEKPDEWLFNFSDNGIGIDPKYHDRIFIMFQRLHGKDEYSGTGIGLAICRKVVENHGGRIWVESKPGHGSTFCFTIPHRRG